MRGVEERKKMQDIATGDLENLFNQIYERNKERVERIALDYTTEEDYCEPEDIEQEIWKRIWEKLPMLEVRSLEEADSWVFQTANNAAVDYSRKSKTRFETWDDDRMVNPCYPYHPLSNADPNTEELKDTLYEAIDTLPEHEQAIIYAYLQDNSYADIEHKFNLTHSQAIRRIRNIKKKLKQLTS